MLETAIVHQSLIRDNLFMGCDRELLLLAALTGLGLALVGQTKVAITTGVGTFLASFFLLKLVGKADPRMRDVYLRYLHYPSGMEASPHPLRPGTVDYR